MTPAVEAALIARLTGLDLFRTVAPIADVADKAPAAQDTPAIYVGYDGFALKEASPTGDASVILENWVAIVVVRSARQGDGGTAARTAALPLARAAYIALSGFAPLPAAGGRCLIPVTPPRPTWDAGFLWLPLAFTYQTVIKD